MACSIRMPQGAKYFVPRLRCDQNTQGTPQGLLYQYFDPGIQATVSLHVFAMDLHLERFSKWQNSDRVAYFWEQTGTLHEHEAYVRKLLQNGSHSMPIVGCIDDEPFSYFEIYWSKEDRIAPHYDFDEYDQGIHMIVGEEHHRGPHKVNAWLTALCDYIFLSEPNTRYIVSEPRVDNEKMISYMEKRGFVKEKEFDFPHKRAALMRLSRDNFYGLHSATTFRNKSP